MNEISSKINNNTDKDQFLEENKIIFKKYKPIKKIDSGAFGNIYSIIDIKNKNLLAMKTEKRNTYPNILESEAYYIYNLQGGIGIPKFISYGHTKNYNILIETLLDKSLYKLFIESGKKCNIIDACLIAHQILDRLEWIHSKDIIYRDIKPENFLIGRKESNIIYVVDFGLCKKYRSSKTGRHITQKITGKFNGTFAYSSPNVVKGKESSRRDDLISLGYMIIYLLKRNLPWTSNCTNLNKGNYQQLIYLKETNGCNKLFEKIPKEFEEYINYTRNLKFEENPNYLYLHSLFNKILFKLNVNYNRINFSWINSKNIKSNSIQKANSQNKKNKMSKEEKFIKSAAIFNKKNKKIFKDDNPKSELNIKNIKNIYSKNIYLNKNSNININNIDLRQIYFNDNKQKINANNKSPERIKLDNNSYLNEIKQGKNFDKIINFKPISHKRPENLQKKILRKVNLTNEMNKWNDIYLNTINYDKNYNNNNDITENSIIKKYYSNNYINKNNKNRKEITKSKLSSNIIYRSPLTRSRKLFKNLLNKSYNNNNFPNIKQYKILKIKKIINTFDSNKYINNYINNNFNTVSENDNYIPDFIKINKLLYIDCNNK